MTGTLNMSPGYWNIKAVCIGGRTEIDRWGASRKIGPADSEVVSAQFEARVRSSAPGTHFPCCTGTKVQILTLRTRREVLRMLSLLA